MTRQPLNEMGSKAPGDRVTALEREARRERAKNTVAMTSTTPSSTPRQSHGRHLNGRQINLQFSSCRDGERNAAVKNENVTIISPAFDNAGSIRPIAAEDEQGQPLPHAVWQQACKGRACTFDPPTQRRARSKLADTHTANGEVFNKSVSPYTAKKIWDQDEYRQPRLTVYPNPTGHNPASNLTKMDSSVSQIEIVTHVQLVHASPSHTIVKWHKIITKILGNIEPTNDKTVSHSVHQDTAPMQKLLPVAPIKLLKAAELETHQQIMSSVNTSS
ncbi:hypothetical protein BDK51DRAFT_32003 [Blyttiomyces helicus]|uniref:Uncharacterized protein n=1 Tax=Blyttiomyces helicus TaxID=388810 RepID=A0A4P9WIX9_9FUNG|nr:hypothetical protein BDK51DRAFT_32003 [Blyttiomyces helicus]|eukprot:RKO91995.1 hypothetical protein BDK51DRAFT_32003 [Blyttiomyces helicus]